jgi:hypothetical protein
MSAVKKPSSVSALRRGIGTHDPGRDLGEIARTDAARDEATGLRPRPEKPVRFTLDLDRDRHRFLKQHAVSLDADASQVLRALLDELRDDPALAGRVRDRIWPWT